MRKAIRVASLALLAAAAVPARARWASLPLEEAVAKADAVVIGALSRVDAAGKAGEAGGSGVLVVEESLSGPFAAKQEVEISWRTLGACGPSVHAKEGEKRIWLLRARGEGDLEARVRSWLVLHPGQVRSIDELDGVKKALSGRKEREDALSLSGTYSVEKGASGSTLRFAIRIENVSKTVSASFIVSSLRSEAGGGCKALWEGGLLRVEGEYRCFCEYEHPDFHAMKVTLAPGETHRLEGTAALKALPDAPRIRCLFSTFLDMEDHQGVGPVRLEGELTLNVSAPAGR